MRIYARQQIWCKRFIGGRENKRGHGRERQTDKKTERKKGTERAGYDIAAARYLGAGQWDSLLLTGGPLHTASDGSRVPASTEAPD